MHAPTEDARANFLADRAPRPAKTCGYLTSCESAAARARAPPDRPSCLREERAKPIDPDELEGPRRARAVEEGRTTEHLFVTEAETPLLSPRTAFETACRRAGLEDVSPHVLRHHVRLPARDGGG